MFHVEPRHGLVRDKELRTIRVGLLPARARAVESHAPEVGIGGFSISDAIWETRIQKKTCLFAMLRMPRPLCYSHSAQPQIRTSTGKAPAALEINAILYIRVFCRVCNRSRRPDTRRTRGTRTRGHEDGMTFSDCRNSSLKFLSQMDLPPLPVPANKRRRAITRVARHTDYCAIDITESSTTAVLVESV